MVPTAPHRGQGSRSVNAVFRDDGIEGPRTADEINSAVTGRWNPFAEMSALYVALRELGAGTETTVVHDDLAVGAFMQECGWKASKPHEACCPCLLEAISTERRSDVRLLGAERGRPLQERVCLGEGWGRLEPLEDLAGPMEDWRGLGRSRECDEAAPLAEQGERRLGEDPKDCQRCATSE